MEKKYCLQLVECEDKSGMDNVYSLEETVCGTWIDGKPLYRKVYKFSGKLKRGSNTDIDISDIYDDVEIFAKVSGVVQNRSTQYPMETVPLPYATLASGVSRAISLRVSTKKIVIRYEVPEYELYDAIVCLEYTKKS